MIGDPVARVSTLLKRTVQVAFVDVLGLTPSEVLSAAAPTGQPATVVPAFLYRGYHVRGDLTAHVAASGHPDFTITPALGPSPRVVRIVAEQMVKSGWHPGDWPPACSGSGQGIREQTSSPTRRALTPRWRG